ncbi:MAG TPA: hypothetical protein ENI61_00735 [Ignavibacteria bacterium]|nr:hypothetical protein [Ignavibacteria bacterium]
MTKKIPSDGWILISILFIEFLLVYFFSDLMTTIFSILGVILLPSFILLIFDEKTKQKEKEVKND